MCDEYYTTDSKYDKSGYIVGTKTDKGMRYGYIDGIKRKQILKNEYNDIYRITDKIDDNNIKCNIGNTAFIYNSLVAYVMGVLCNVDIENIKKGIETFKLTSNRLEFKKLNNGATLIDDTYNASLDSIKSSLEILIKREGKRKIAIIGDVLELGTFSKSLHEEIGKVLLNSNLDYIITIGNETKYTDEYLKNNNYDNLKHFNNENESYEYIDSLLKDGDLVLFKGSHGMHLSNIIKYLVDNEK